jgi:hypothetical protein
MAQIHLVILYINLIVDNRIIDEISLIAIFIIYYLLLNLFLQKRYKKYTKYMRSKLNRFF